jgi:hypothetical protein
MTKIAKQGLVSPAPLLGAASGAIAASSVARAMRSDFYGSGTALHHGQGQG